MNNKRAQIPLDNKKNRTKKNYLTGQVLLETAIVLVSLATLAVASMRLYSTLNLNMTGRLDKYRQSRESAVNSSAIVNPVDFLDYSPYHNIITPGDGGGNWDFSEIFYQDQRVVTAEQLLNRTDDILNVILPYKINQVYELLGGDDDSYTALVKITKEDVQQAKILCEEMNALRQEAYDNYYEDMDEANAFDGIDHNGNGFYGAVSLLQQVLYQPIIPGPFDYEDQHQGNRTQLEGIINNLTATDAKNALNTLLNELLKPRLDNAIAYLELALEKWQCYQSGVLGASECICPESKEEIDISATLCRVEYIQNAQSYIKEMVDFLGTIKTIPSLAEQQISTQLYDINALLTEPLLESRVVSAVDDSGQMLKILEAQEAATGNSYSSLKDLVNDIKDELNSAVSSWDNEAERDIYIDKAKEKLNSLEEIVNA